MKKKHMTMRIDAKTETSLAFLAEQSEGLTKTDIICTAVNQIASALKKNLDAESFLDFDSLPSYVKMERKRTIDAFKEADNWVFSEKNNFCHFCGKSGQWVCNRCHAKYPGLIVDDAQNNYGWIKEKEELK